ncbi:hypothetical protein Tco_1022829, partial [Tanacetum coccineum]
MRLRALGMVTPPSALCLGGRDPTSALANGIGHGVKPPTGVGHEEEEEAKESFYISGPCGFSLLWF